MIISNKMLKDQEVRSAAEDASPVLHWDLAPDTIRLEPKQVHLWAATLTDFLDQLPELEVLLFPTEVARRRKLKFIEDRNQYTIRHGLSKLILGRYFKSLPSAIEFQNGPHGKPEVRSNIASPHRFFNSSHSAQIAVFAITSECQIGVDIERIREIPEIEELACRFFRPSEIRTLMALPSNSRLQAFYACWTRKEAFLKATGEGIAESLAAVEVTLAPGDKPEIVSISGDRLAREQWQLQPFSPAQGYIGCLAYRDSRLDVNAWRVAQSTILGSFAR